MDLSTYNMDISPIQIMDISPIHNSKIQSMRKKKLTNENENN